MLKMKILYILLFFILLFSCKQEADNGIKIDLTQKKTKIRYSEFVDSVSYIRTIHASFPKSGNYM